MNKLNVFNKTWKQQMKKYESIMPMMNDVCLYYMYVYKTNEWMIKYMMILIKEKKNSNQSKFVKFYVYSYDEYDMTK